MQTQRLLVLSRYPLNGPSSHVRFYQYFPALRAAGFQLDVHPFFSEDYVEALFGRGRLHPASILRAYARRLLVARTIQPGDIVWMQYELLPWLSSWVGRGLLRRAAALVVDYDDAVFHRYDRHRLLLVRALLGGKIGATMRMASVVVAGNPYLADYARRAGTSRIEMLPSVVDLDAYQQRASHAHHQCLIGWIGSPTTARYLQLLERILPSVLTPTVRMVLIGAPPIGGLPADKVDYWPWDLKQEARLISHLDIGVMPLADEPFERGKCGYKLIQYMASGLPVVASPVGVNQDLVRHGENGFLASTEQEWVDALRYLINHPMERKKMGAKGRELVAARYSLQVTAPLLVKIFQSL